MLNLDDATHLYNLGYYKCNGVIFYSKIKASIYSSAVKKPLEWIYNDDLFNSYDWTLEPLQTLDELYNKRARELREKYDYIVVSFSGGSDSYNVIQSFIRQGLYIDEIVTNHLTKGAEKLTVLDKQVTNAWNLNAEHELQAIPRLKEIQNLCPKTKITILDTTDSVLSELKNKKDAEWVMSRKDGLFLTMSHRYNHFYFASVKKQFDKNLSIAIVTGLDKPRIHINDTKVYFTLTDTGGANMAGVHDHNEYPNATVEHFYWGREAIDIMCKQSHVIKNWLTINRTYIDLWRNQNFVSWRKIIEPMTKNIIYTTWNQSWFQAAKATGGWHNEFDTWAHSQLAGTRELEVWKAGIAYVAKMAPDHVVFAPNTKTPDGFKVIKKTFYIGDIVHL